MPTTDTPTNPYVGPRTFTAADRKRFFGRETEAAGLLARVVSERLLLFYATRDPDFRVQMVGVAAAPPDSLDRQELPDATP